MDTERPIPELALRIVDLVTGMMNEIRPRLVQAALTGQRAENANLRHQDNFLSDHDLWMHGRYKDLLAEVMPSFIYASEEADPQVIGSAEHPDLCVLVDPLDTSELAVRALHGYTHIMIYSRSRKRPVLAVVGDIFHHVRLYVAGCDENGDDHAFTVTADGKWHPLNRPSNARLSQALVTNYLMRPDERFKPLADQQRFFDALSEPGSNGKKKGRIGVDFGSVSLCHVAAGFTDATVEFAKGFAVWDLAPGHYILHAAGGVTIDLEGHPITLDYGLNSMPEINKTMNTRRRFIAAGNQPLAEEILRTIRPTSSTPS
ncbi:inositol monophosphatase family protein [Lentzea sp. BCCO 10_0856]|uniref:Inositol monophosphatase family protein n=1 Tax=Lentzea miocenica TaxID=3095431 RepID=A0ABU4SZ77_9PSEU|nr:inositol monophosphatase family protein [Lentzea sp. BCCO 10_0856]MDX8031216.1 inositol monophosphatase family protein [Lentzea sp. BCCO 10_0856]